MSEFRKPKTQNERKADHALASEDACEKRIKARARTLKKVEAAPPTDWSDIQPAASKDRSRGKRGHSAARKAQNTIKRRS